MAFDDAEYALAPMAFVARTWNVYLPGARPETDALVAEPPTVTVLPPGDVFTVYDVIADPPSLAGVFHVTLMALPFGAAFTFVGAPGATSAGDTVSVGELVEPVPWYPACVGVYVAERL